MKSILLSLFTLTALAAVDNLELYSKLYNQTMEWGTYKPNQFFAIKDRSAKPMTVGLLWAVPQG